MKQQQKTSPTTQAEENAETIRAIPFDQLPDAQARAELVRRALAGQDVYAYKPLGDPLYVVWVRQPWADVEARFRPLQWAWLWRAGVQPDTQGAVP